MTRKHHAAMMRLFILGLAMTFIGCATSVEMKGEPSKTTQQASAQKPAGGDVSLVLGVKKEAPPPPIDLYPAIYRGKDRVPWNYQTPFLTYARDFPALAHGYRLPAYRLAIEVIP